MRNMTDGLHPVALEARIRKLSAEEIEQRAERASRIRDSLNSLDARLEELSPRDREAVLSLLYQEVGAVVFSFHLALALKSNRDQISPDSTVDDMKAALEEFVGSVNDLAQLHA